MFSEQVKLCKFEKVESGSSLLLSQTLKSIWKKLTHFLFLTEILGIIVNNKLMYVTSVEKNSVENYFADIIKPSYFNPSPPTNSHIKTKDYNDKLFYATPTFPNPVKSRWVKSSNGLHFYLNIILLRNMSQYANKWFAYCVSWLKKN